MIWGKYIQETGNIFTKRLIAESLSTINYFLSFSMLYSIFYNSSPQFKTHL